MSAQDRSDVALLYRRAGFGATGAELDRAAAGGYDAAVDALLSGLDGPDPAGDAVAVPTFPSYRRLSRQATVQERQAANQQQRAALLALQEWWVERMIVTGRPLREKLTLFWHGHFATGASKVRDARLMYQQNDLLRRMGSGRFGDLTQAVAKDGAMMVWLDTGSDKKGHPNENFARELMELFTVGLGVYTQDDVTAAARAFTGWTFDRAAYRYVFRPAQHDEGTKTFLGHTGDLAGEDVVSILVQRPESARFVMSKLWSHFAYPVTPADPVVRDLVAAYGPGLDIRAALGALFRHPEFRSEATRVGLVKQPAEWLVGAARALGLHTAAPAGARPPAPRAGTGLAAVSTALGQQLFNPPNVGGWGQNHYWLDTATAQLRLKAALALADRADLSPLASGPTAQRVDAVADLLGLDGWGPTSRAALEPLAARPAQMVALALVSPEYVLA